MALATLAFFLFSVGPAALGEPYFDQKERGWFWYELFPPRGEDKQPESRENR